MSTPLIEIFGGTRYIVAAGSLAICAIIIGLASPSVAINAKLLGLGCAAPLVSANILAILAGTLMSFILIPNIGLIGAALTHSIMLMVLLGITSTALKSKQELNLDWKMVFHASIGSIVLFVVVSVQMIIYSVLFLPEYVFVGALEYAGYMRLTGTTTAEDLAFLKKLLPNDLHWAVRIAEHLLVRK